MPALTGPDTDSTGQGRAGQCAHALTTVWVLHGTQGARSGHLSRFLPPGTLSAAGGDSTGEGEGEGAAGLAPLLLFGGRGYGLGEGEVPGWMDGTVHTHPSL